MLFEITDRQLTLLIALPVAAIIFVILGILILRRDKDYLGNKCFALFFWLSALGLGFNLMYLFSTNIPLVKYGNLASIQSVNASVVALLFGTLVLYKGETEIVQNKKSLVLLIAFIAAIVFQCLIPDSIIVVEPEPGSLDPTWSIPYGLTVLVFTQLIMIAIIVLSAQLFKDFSAEIKKKFSLYLIGLIMADITLLTITLDNLPILAELSSIFSYLNMLVIIGSILIYFGIVRRSQ
ncbi:MAG: hypothetical protein ACFFCS_10660 [Candidatus Hodarchaeota archaeon]